MQSRTEPGRNLECAFVADDDQHLACAVVHGAAAVAMAEMTFDHATQLRRHIPVHIIREVCNYRLAANHGLTPFQRSHTETLGFAKIGLSASRIMRRARCSRVFTTGTLTFRISAASSTFK